MQGTWVLSLVWRDSTCCRATKLLRHKYWSPGTLEPHSVTAEAVCCTHWSPSPWGLCPPRGEATSIGSSHTATDAVQPKKGGGLHAFICVILTGNFKREQKSKNTYNSTTLRTWHNKAEVSSLCSSFLHLRPEVIPFNCSCTSFWASVHFYMCSHGVGGFPGGTSDKEPTCQET